MSESDHVKEHFEAEAHEFDRLIWKLIPYYNEMADAVVSSIPFETGDRVNILDLGCGTGNMTKKIKDCFVNSVITCVDFSDNMLEAAEKKLSGKDGVRYVKSDISELVLEAGYNAVVSSLAIHHLEDSQKIQLFRTVFDCLCEGGIFVNADIVLGSADTIQKTYVMKWKEYMLRNVPSDEIENTWIPKYEREDKPAVLIDQTRWLEEAGFRNVDIVWKYYNFGVYCGFK